MEKNELLQNIESVCSPDCKVEILSTCRGSESKLVVVKYPETAISTNIYDDTAFVKSIEDFHYNNVLPQLISAKKCRTIYCCGNRFILYSSYSDVLMGFVLYYRARHGISYNFEGKRGHRKYVGACTDIESLINYLTTVKNVKL